MAEMRFCVGFSSACKQARQGGGLPASEEEDSPVLRPFLPPDLVRLIDALVRRLKHEDTLLAMNGGELGRTLCEAAEAGGLLDVRFLLARGADVDARSVYVKRDGKELNWTALQWAARFGHLAVCSSLLDAGAARRDSALYTASFNGRSPVVALLLDRGANIHFRDGSALVGSAQKGHLATATLLLDRGADIHAQDGRPVVLSAQRGHSEMVRLLLDRGADRHIGNEQPLRIAAERGHLETVRLLLDRGADIHARNDYALRFARLGGHADIEALLLERGALEPHA
jgi:ankyrin repeat protein